MTARLALGFDLGFDDLYDREGLARLDDRFLAGSASATAS